MPSVHVRFHSAASGKTRAGRALLLACALLTGACAVTPNHFSDRLETPRLAPVDPSDPALSAGQKDMLASRANYNIYKTLAHHPGLYSEWSPLGQFLLRGSSLPPRHREMAMLRMGWLCQAEYEWSQHARIAKADAGLTQADVHRIAEGPEAEGWSDIDRAVLRMADEIRYDAMISDATWADLRKTYSDNEVMELLFTTAQYQLVSMALNTLGVQLDPELDDRLPKDVARPAVALPARGPRLASPRIAPVDTSNLTEAQKALAAQHIRPDGTLFNLYRTLLNHPGLYGPRARFGRYLLRDSLLPAQTREMLILRTALLHGTDYEWGHHIEAAKAAGLSDIQIAWIAEGPDASGWTKAERAVLAAADDLRREAFVTGPVWAELSRSYDTRQLVEIVYTVGGYAMTAAAINSFGIQLEPGYPRLPR